MENSNFAVKKGVVIFAAVMIFVISVFVQTPLLAIKEWPIKIKTAQSAHTVQTAHAAERAYAFSQYYTHPALTEEIARLYKIKAGKEILQSDLENLRQGSISEDELPRPMNHFYDPVHKTGWNAQKFSNLASPESKKILTKFAHLEPLPAPDWAISQESQAEYARYFGNQTWQRALNEYINGNSNEAYTALGHILHLIEDMGVPDHTRDDTHVHFPGEPGSPFETFSRLYTDDNELNFVKILESRKIPFFENLREAFDYVAMYSNQNFFSEDTIFDTSFKKPDIKAAKHIVLRSGFDKTTESLIAAAAGAIGSRNERNNAEVYLAQGKIVLVKIIDSQKKDKNILRLTTDDPVVLKSYFENLGSRIVITGAGVLDLFFREAEYYRQNPGELQPVLVIDKKKFRESTPREIVKTGANKLASFAEKIGRVPFAKLSSKSAKAGDIDNLAQTENPPENPPENQDQKDPKPEIDIFKAVLGGLKIGLEAARGVPAAHSRPQDAANVAVQKNFADPHFKGENNFLAFANLTKPAGASLPAKDLPEIRPPEESVPTSNTLGTSNAGPPAGGSAWVSHPAHPETEPASTIQSATETESPPPTEFQTGGSDIAVSDNPPVSAADNSASSTAVVGNIISKIVLTAEPLPDAGDFLILWSFSSDIGSSELRSGADFGEKSGFGTEIEIQFSVDSGASWIPLVKTSGRAYRYKGESGLPHKFRARAIFQELAEIGEWVETTEVFETPALPKTVVINEISPFDSDPYGEWVELYNNTGKTISLEGWTIQAGASLEDMSKIGLYGTMPGYSYVIFSGKSAQFLIDGARTRKVFGSFADNYRIKEPVLSLYNSNGEKIDHVDLRFLEEITGVKAESGAKTLMRAHSVLTGSSISNWKDASDWNYAWASFGEKIIPGTPLRSNRKPVEISGNIIENQILNVFDGPYIIGNTTIKELVYFAVLPGAVVKFRSGAELKVDEGASFQILGNSEFPVMITSIYDSEAGGKFVSEDKSPQKGDWKSITLNSSNAIIENAAVKYGRISFLKNSSGRAASNIFMHSKNSVYVENSENEIIISGNVFDYGNVKVKNAANVRFLDNEIKNPEDAIFIDSSGSAFINSSGEIGGNTVNNSVMNAIDVKGNISGSLEIHGGSPGGSNNNSYIRFESPVVQKGGILKIGQGVKVGVDDSAKEITVMGKMELNGEPDAPVIITSQYDASNLPGFEMNPLYGTRFDNNMWDGMIVSDGGEVNLTNAKVLFGEHYTNGGTMRIIGNSTVNVKNSEIKRRSSILSPVIIMENAAGTFEDCSISGSNIGIKLSQNATAQVKNCVFPSVEIPMKNNNVL